MLSARKGVHDHRAVDTVGDDGTVTIDRVDRHDALDSATLPALESALADALTDDVAVPGTRPGPWSRVRPSRRGRPHPERRYLKST